MKSGKQRISEMSGKADSHLPLWMKRARIGIFGSIIHFTFRIIMFLSNPPSFPTMNCSIYDPPILNRHNCIHALVAVWNGSPFPCYVRSRCSFWLSISSSLRVLKSNPPRWMGHLYSIGKWKSWLQIRKCKRWILQQPLEVRRRKQISVCTSP